MRLLSLLFTLLIIALLLYTQLGGNANKPVANPSQPAADVGQLPSVPSRPEDVAKFGQQMDTFMQNSNADMEQKLKQAEGN